MATASSTGFDRLERACHGLAASLVLFGGLCLVVACGLTVASILGG